MNNEIKEILDYFKRDDKNNFGYNQAKILNDEQAKLLLDYITNLQQENERLKEWKEDLLNENIELENIRKEAIEYIKENKEGTDICGDTYIGLDAVEINDLLNILQNGSDSQ